MYTLSCWQQLLCLNLIFEKKKQAHPSTQNSIADDKKFFARNLWNRTPVIKITINATICTLNTIRWVSVGVCFLFCMQWHSGQMSRKIIFEKRNNEKIRRICQFSENITVISRIFSYCFCWFRITSAYWFHQIVITFFHFIIGLEGSSYWSFFL